MRYAPRPPIRFGTTLYRRLHSHNISLLTAALVGVSPDVLQTCTAIPKLFKTCVAVWINPYMIERERIRYAGTLPKLHSRTKGGS